MSWRGIVIAVAVTVLTGCDGEGIPRAAVAGSPAPAYEAVTYDGAAVTLAEQRGRVVLLNVWATWCPPCREEIPALQELHERHADRGLEVVGVSIDARGERENVRDFLDSFGVTYPIWLDPGERVTSTFRTQGVPTTFLIDREGTVVWRHVGPVTADDPELNRVLEEALGGANGSRP